MSTVVPFWSMVELRNDSVTAEAPSANLADFESWTGKAELSEPIKVTGTPFSEGDVLFGKLRPYLAKSWLANAPGVAVGDIHVYSPKKHVDPGYLSYVVRTPEFVKWASSQSTGTKMPRTEWSAISTFRSPCPPLETQRRITDYLERETTQIDETITRLDKVVELLEERRARLHRDAFSDNYSTTSLVTIADISLGKMLDQKNTVGEPTEYLRAANVRKDGTIDLADTKQMLMTEDERERYELQAGDILMVEGGDAGRVALLSDDLPGLAIQKTLMRIRINTAVADPAYCYWWIDHLHKSGVLALDYSVSTIAHFTAEKAQRIRIPLPPLEAQKKTAKSLQEYNLEVEEMVNQAFLLKSLLEERRSALITAAVTGRIGV